LILLVRYAQDQEAALYRHKIVEAMTKLGASYQITLGLINHPVEAGDVLDRVHLNFCGTSAHATLKNLRRKVL
jgi:hypothetical protein